MSHKAGKTSQGGGLVTHFWSDEERKGVMEATDSAHSQ